MGRSIYNRKKGRETSDSEIIGKAKVYGKGLKMACDPAVKTGIRVTLEPFVQLRLELMIQKNR